MSTHLSSSEGLAGGADLSPAALDEVFGLLRDGLVLVDDDDTVRYAAPQVGSLLGVDRASLIGAPLRAIVDGEQLEVVATLGPDGADRVTDGVVVRLRRPGGGWADVSVTAVRGEALTRSGLRALVLRSDEPTHTLDALRHRLAFEDLLTRVASSFILRPADELDPTIDAALAEIGAFAGADRASLYLLDDDRGLVVCRHHFETDATVGPPTPVAAQSDLPAWLAQLRAMDDLYIPRVDALDDGWAAEREFLDAQGTRSCVAAPLVDSGRLVGFVSFDSVTRERMWADDHLGLLASTAGIISQALARAAAEQRFVTAFTAAPLGMALHAPDGRHLQVNDTYCELVGRSEAELLGHSVIEVVPPEEQDALLDRYADLVSGRATRITHELRTEHADGQVRWFRSHSSSVRAPDGSLRYLVTHLEDITARHQQELDLRLSEERYRTLVENSPAIVTRFDRQGRMVYMSPAFEEIGLYTVDEVLGQTNRMFSEGDEHLGWSEALRKVFETGERQDTEWRVQVRGEPRWFQSRAVPEFGEDGEVEHALVMNTDITALKRSEAELAHRALHDPLTGLPNRVLLLERLEHALAERSRRSGDLAVLFLDLDRFKVVNDSLGHTAGDRLLTVVAERLAALVRAGDTVARLGGDEFVLVLDEIEGPEELLVVVDRILQALRQPVVIDGDGIVTTASLGVALASSSGGSGGATPDGLMSDADAAMYRAKARGRDRFELFDEELRTQVTRRLHLERFLRRALELGELEVHYQPELDLAAGRVVGCEALLRWNHPDEGLLEASRFIELAEESGLIVELGAWVLRQACTQVGRWDAEGRRVDTMRVNLSAHQIGQADLVPSVVAALAEAGVEPGRLCLEITETTVMADAETSLAVLSDLRDLGVDLAIDDFGTGYSSLSYLKRLPVGVLKIDRSFVDGLGDEAEDTAIVDAIVSLARSLSLRLVAEGVETATQLTALVALGCDRAQGYLFSPAVPAAEFWSVADRVHREHGER